MRTLAKLKKEVGLWWHETPKPIIGHNDVLIKIKKTAICGTDIHIYNWDEWAQQTIPVPLVTGHEFVGEVVDMGSEVKALSLGQRVSGEGHVTCGLCRNCRAGKRYLCRDIVNLGVTRPGAFAEYLSLPAMNVFPLSNKVTDDMASILDPFGNATHTTLSFDLVGEDVLITGAGPIGIMAAAIAKHVGARNIVITDINDYRLKLAEKMGVTRAVNVKNEQLKQVMAELGMLEGFDIGLEVSGSSNAFNAMLNVMNHGSKIAMLGFLPNDTQINWNNIILKGITIKGIYGREMFETWYKMQSMLESGLDISPVITHHFKVDDFQAAFDVMLSGQAGKVILDWQS